MENITRQAMAAIVQQLAALDMKLDSWAYDSILSVLAVAIGKAYAVGQKDVLDTMERVARVKRSPAPLEFQKDEGRTETIRRSGNRPLSSLYPNDPIYRIPDKEVM